MVKKMYDNNAVLFVDTSPYIQHAVDENCGKIHRTLIDIAVTADQNIIKTEDEKVTEYQDLALEVKRIHRASKVTISKNAKTWHRKLDIPDIVGSTQLSAILGTAHILRKSRDQQADATANDDVTNRQGDECTEEQLT
eukprot:gene12335-2985_t